MNKDYRIIIPAELVEKIKIRFQESANNIGEFNEENLSITLDDFLKSFNSHDIVTYSLSNLYGCYSKDNLVRAFGKARKDNGAFKKLRTLLCYYAMGIGTSWDETLGILGIDLHDTTNEQQNVSQYTTYYDVYGYSIYRKDLFYYKLKLFYQSESKGRREYLVELLTFDIDLKLNSTFSGDAFSLGSYAYFTIYVKNSKEEIKKEFYFIAYIGDKVLETVYTTFATYCIPSRDMKLSAGEVIMQRVVDDSIPEILPLSVRRHFHIHRSQLRFPCNTLINMSDLAIETGLFKRLAEMTGTYKLICFIKEGDTKMLYEYVLDLKEDYNSSIFSQHGEHRCLVKMDGNNLILEAVEDHPYNINRVIIQLVKHKMMQGVYIGVDDTGKPVSGNIILLKSNENILPMVFVDEKLNDFKAQGKEYEKIWEILII